MFSRLWRFIGRLWRPYGTPYTPASFGLNDAEFLLAVLRTCPSGSLVEFDQCEPETWVNKLREWSRRSSADQFEADGYLVDDRFTAALDELLHSDPESLNQIHHMSIVGPDHRYLMASVDNFSILTALDDTIRDRLVCRESPDGEIT
jgi:hypothetical protein